MIFSDEVDAQAIEDHFLHDLKFTAESSPADPDQRWPLTVANLESLGSKLKNEQEEFRRLSDLQVGMMNAVIVAEDVRSVLQNRAMLFKDRHLLVVPADEDLSECSWTGQAHQTRKLFIQMSHMLFSSNPGTRAFGLGMKHLTVRDFVREFKSRKPCVHGSDAHEYGNLFEPAEGRQLWIKADPTFQGLRQLLHEPESRVYIGPEHPSFRA